MLEARFDNRSLEMWSRAEFDKSERKNGDEGEFVGWVIGRRKNDAADFEDAQAAKTSRGNVDIWRRGREGRYRSGWRPQVLW